MVDRVAADHNHAVAGRFADGAVDIEHHLRRCARTVAPDEIGRRYRAHVRNVVHVEIEEIVRYVIGLDELEAPIAEASDLLRDSLFHLRHGRVEIALIAGKLERIGRFLPCAHRPVPKPGLGAERGDLGGKGLHIHSERLARPVPRSAAAVEIPALLLDRRRRIVLPAVIHDHVRAHLQPLGHRRHIRRIRQEVRRRILAVRAIPVVVAVDGLFRKPRRGAHHPAERPARNVCALSRNAFAVQKRRRFENAPAELYADAAGADVEHGLDRPRPNVPGDEAVGLRAHAPAVGPSAALGKEKPLRLQLVPKLHPASSGVVGVNASAGGDIAFPAHPHVFKRRGRSGNLHPAALGGVDKRNRNLLADPPLAALHKLFGKAFAFSPDLRRLRHEGIRAAKSVITEIPEARPLARLLLKTGADKHILRAFRHARQRPEPAP